MDPWVLVAGAVLGAAAIAGILAAYPLVGNRHAFGWDGALRTIGDLEAARALRAFEPLRFLWYVLGTGPEVWPTLRTLVAAPLLAVVGPSLDAENAITIASYGGLFAVLAAAAARLAPSRAQALLLLAIAAGALAATRPLLNWAAASYLEVLSALSTLAATIAWIRLRERGDGAAVWPLALLGNLVFHSKYQYGILFAVAVIATEALALAAPDRRRALRALGVAARAAARRPSTWIWVVAATAFAGAAALAARHEGGAFAVAGISISMRRPHAPITWAAILAFYGVQLALWRSRATLRAEIPARLRSLWVWLATPMAVWILVPFTWRLRMLLFTTVTFDSGAAPAGIVEAILFYPRAIAQDWYASPAGAAVLVGLALTAVAAVRAPEVRRRLVPIAAVCAVELLVLGLGARTNFQPRFALNLAPLVALSAALWVPAAARWVRVVGGGGIVLATALAVSALWRPPELAVALSEGRMGMPVDVVERCEAAAGSARFSDATLVVALPDELRQDCALRVDIAAWRRGVRLEHWHKQRPLRAEVVHLDVDCAPPAVALDARVLVSERRDSGVCVRVFGPRG